MTGQQTQISVIEAFKATMRQFPATVTVITARHRDVDHGMTVTAVTSVSMSPPSMVVCLNNRTLLHEMLIDQPFFCVNVLGVEHVELSNAFSGAVDPEERFSPGLWSRDANGVPCLKSAHARVRCRRVAAVPYGTHTMFVGEALHASVSEAGSPLSYLDATYCVADPVSVTDRPE